MEYLPLLHDLGLPRQPRVFEWCAEPGFIGFALRGYGFRDTLCGRMGRHIAAPVNSDQLSAHLQRAAISTILIGFPKHG